MSEESAAAVRCKDRKEFYDRTRPDKIEALCEDIREKISNNTPKRNKNGKSGSRQKSSSDNIAKKKNKNGELGAWKNSLPDFAELLHTPESYRERFLKEAELLLGKIDVEISFFEYVLKKLKTVDIGEVLDSSSADKYKSIVPPVENILPCLKEQKKKLEERLNDIKKHKAEKPLQGVQIDIEYPVPDKKNPDIIHRIDVLLSKPGTNKYVIVELKQWTEEKIHSVEDGLRYQIAQYTKELDHPVIKVKNEYRNELGEKLNGDADILCIVYLHNQMFIDGILYEEAKKQNINIYEDYSGDHNAILYTKPWHGALLAKLHNFFD